MLKTRVIPTLLYRDFGLVKGVGFDTRRQIGGALQAIKVYNLRGVDELIFVDVTATQQGRTPDLALVDELADDCFMPLTVGGGVRAVEHIGQLLDVGADKVSIGSAAVDDPGLVEAGAIRYGAQCIVASIDYRIDADGDARVWTHSGTRSTTHDPVTVARRLEDAGAGEILLTCIDRDGTMAGYDLETTRLVCDAVRIPVIASGGAGAYEHMAEAVECGAAAVAAASIFHFTQMNPMDAKHHLASRGIPVRR
jgi:cyclase